MGQRILTAIILIALALSAFFSQSLSLLWAVSLLVFLVATAELREISTSGPARYFGLLFLPIPLILNLWLHSNSIVTTLLLVLTATSLLTVAALWCNPTLLNGSAKAATLSFYIAGGLMSPLLLLHHAGFAWNYRPEILVVFVPVWAADSAGYFVGRSFGKHLLAPAISPKKTVEGAIGNGLFAVMFGLGAAAWCRVPLSGGILIGALIGVLGQVGDLFESQLKRSASLKDSGSLLPGHGGVLDRIDSLLLTAPITCLVLALLTR